VKPNFAQSRRDPSAHGLDEATVAIAVRPSEVEPTLRRGASKESAPPKQVLDLLAVALSHGRFVDASTALATELATMFHCDRVSVGFLRKRYVTVAAMSHSAEIHERQSLIQQIANAMDECADQQRTLVFPAPADGKPSITHFHAKLAQRSTSAQLCSVPIVRQGALCGVITFERKANQPFEANTVRLLEHVASLLGPVLDLQCARERGLFAMLRERMGGQIKSCLGSGYLTTKLIAGSLALIVLVAAVIPAQYRVSAPARLEGSVQRMVVAPADGYLKQVHVRPGNLVKQGQLVAELARETFDLERRKWESEIAQYENAYRDAMAKHNRLEVVTAQARIEETRAQLALANDKLDRTQILAPFDGIVIKGDLTQSLGAPVKQGDLLLTIAPADDYRVMIEVDERDIADIRVGRHGNLALTASPKQAFPITVLRPTPVAASADGRNYFEVEAKLNATDDVLRPGLKGVAKIEMEQRSLLWIWGHRAMDSLRLMTWSWIN
jgi:RND family efflux transporter MFP subunit